MHSVDLTLKKPPLIIECLKPKGIILKYFGLLHLKYYSIRGSFSEPCAFHRKYNWISLKPDHIERIKLLKLLLVPIGSWVIFFVVQVRQKSRLFVIFSQVIVIFEVIGRPYGALDHHVVR